MSFTQRKCLIEEGGHCFSMPCSDCPTPELHEPIIADEPFLPEKRWDVQDLLEALLTAERQFLGYAHAHDQKTPPDHIKAQTNRDMAHKMREAIEGYRRDNVVL